MGCFKRGYVHKLLQASRPSPDKSREYTPKYADAVRPPAAGALSADASLPAVGDLYAAHPELPAGLRFDGPGAAQQWSIAAICYGTWACSICQAGCTRGLAAQLGIT